MPNVGKSTLFNALTRAGIAAENYPFCTIDPNVGIVPVPDPRLAALAAIAKPEKILPTTVEFVDIAGLVAGASQGEGLGNKFLAHIREVDAIAHVVRCFEDPDVVHVSGRVDPAADVAIINTELALADLETVDRARQRAEKSAKAMDKDAMRWRDSLERIRARLDEGEPVRAMALDSFERERIRELSLLTSKPVMYVANVDEGGFAGNARLETLEKLSVAEGSAVVAVCAAIEAEISELDEADRAAFLADLGLAEAGLDRIIRAGYRLLGLLTFFTAGPEGSACLDRAFRARPRRRRREPYTPISSADSSARRRSPTTTMSRSRARPARARPGACASKARSTSCREGDVMHFRFNVS